MLRLQINDKAPEGFLAFDLRDVLRALGPEVLRWTWIASTVEGTGERVWATGRGGVELEALERSGEPVSGSRLLDMAERTEQVIWGEFRAYRDGRREPWVRIVAFDSSLYEVWCEDEATLTGVKSAFKDTTLASPIS